MTDREATKSPKSGRGPFARWLGNFSLLGIMLVLLAGLCELTVRLVLPQQLILKRPDIWVPRDGLGWSHRPNLATTINTGERTVHVYTDEDGFRVGKEGRRDTARKILFLGDSFLEAFQVEYEDSIAGRLERDLPPVVGESVSVINTAVGGWGPSQYLLQAREILPKTSVDLVVTGIYVGNDVVAKKRRRFRPRTPTEVHHFHIPADGSAEAWRDAFFYPINDFFEVRSHLFILVKRRASILLARLGLTASYFPVELLTKSRDRPHWNVTADIAAEIERLAQSHDTPALFVLIPAPQQVDPQAFEQSLASFGLEPEDVDIDQPNRILYDALRERGLEVVDLLPSLRDADDPGALYGKIDAHLTPDGNELSAKRILAPAMKCCSGR